MEVSGNLSKIADSNAHAHFLIRTVLRTDESIPIEIWVCRRRCVDYWFFLDARSIGVDRVRLYIGSPMIDGNEVI